MKWRNLTQVLGIRITVMLLIALTPVGLIAIWQTNKVIESNKTAAEAALVAQTIKDAKGQSHTFQRAFGAAGAIGAAILPGLDNPVICDDILSAFVESRPQFTYAHFVNTQGTAVCRSATGVPREVTESRVVNMLADPRERVSWSEPSDQFGAALLTIETPVFLKDQLQGYVSFTLLPDSFEFKDLAPGDTAPKFLLTFNEFGHVLTASARPAELEPMLPANRSLISFVGQASQVFRDRSVSGEQFIYSVTPTIANTVYAFGIWTDDNIVLKSDRVGQIALFFPILMLLVSIGVAYFAVHRLVIRHISQLRSKILRFKKGDRRIDVQSTPGAPIELFEIDETFVEMAQQITLEEAEAENLLHERNVLLKEVHHRVKNNLQLIVSILNMQMRGVTHVETKLALKRIQDRVLGLATVHGNLYQSQALSSVRADKLLGDVVQQLLVVGELPGESIDVKMTLDEVSLYPDQAVPFSLMVAESVTNALKYIGTPSPDVAPWMRVTLHYDEPTRAVAFSISNSTGPKAVVVEEDTGTGLGSQLIGVFVSQLEATMTKTDADDAYVLEVNFENQAFQENP